MNDPGLFFYLTKFNLPSFEKKVEKIPHLYKNTHLLLLLL